MDPKMPDKKPTPTSYRLSLDARAALRRRAAEERRSATKHLEHLISQDSEAHPPKKEQ